MTKIIALLMAAGFLLTGCVVVPVGMDQPSAAGFCPPGQAKKGNCTVGEQRGSCPPGQAKKGNC